MNAFKPGDVVVHPKRGRGIVTGDHRPEYVEFSDVECEDIDYVAADLRRLVVIDPDSREDVERLRDILLDSGWSPERDADALDDILREFANPKPPKPEEPTGLGAVVEDAEGSKWVRIESRTGWWWRNPVGQTHRWSDIDAVRILSEGVQP